MTGHITIHTGAGWRCQRCGVSWDQGETPEGDCVTLGDLVEKMIVDDGGPFIEKALGGSGETIDITTFGTATRYHSGGLGRLEPGEVPGILSSGSVLPKGDRRLDAVSAGGASKVTLETVVNITVADPMQRQVGGAHYRDLAIQPTEFAQKNGYDFCSGSILKYLTRHRMKNGIEDLKKARHFVEIRESLGVFNVVGNVIPMSKYILQPGINSSDAAALALLDIYVKHGSSGARMHTAHRLVEEIDKLIAA